MTTMAAPIPARSSLSSSVTAVRPPAEAPMPTTGNREEGAATAFSVTSDAALREDVDAVLAWDLLRDDRFLPEGPLLMHEGLVKWFSGERVERSHAKQTASGVTETARSRVLKRGS